MRPYKQMNEQIDEGEDTNPTCIKMLNNLYRYSTFQEVEHNSPPFKCGLRIVTAFQRTVKNGERKRITLVLPCWRSGWESACQCRVHRFEPWSGKIPHATEQLGPWATATEPARLEPVLHNKRGRDSERPAHRDEEWPPLAAIRESPRTEMKTQHSHK